MKRTILASLLAATFAGTAQGEVLEIKCIWGADPNPDADADIFQFDMEQKTAFKVGAPDGEEFRVIIWNDSFIAWNHLMVGGLYPSIGTYMIDRATLKLQAAYVMLGIPEVSIHSSAECVRPL